MPLPGEIVSPASNVSFSHFPVSLLDTLTPNLIFVGNRNEDQVEASSGPVIVRWTYFRELAFG